MYAYFMEAKPMKYLLFTGLIFLFLTGCVLSAPRYPTTDPCLALHTIGVPECSPPNDQLSTVPPPGPTTAAWLTKAAPKPLQPYSSTSTIYPVPSVTILVDDFTPQPYQGDTVYFYNRLEGDRGALNNTIISWNSGTAKATITSGNTWGGMWMSLNHPIREKQSVNFSAILPPQILPAYQSRIIGITVTIADGTPSKQFRVELKDSNNNLQWSREITMSGGRQAMDMELPPLQEISQLVLVLDHASGGDFVVIDNISLSAETPVIDTATAAFVWSYGMLLNNWNPDTGLVRDKAKDASGEFDAIQATGSLAAATVLAEQVGIIHHTDAVAIVNKISQTLLNKLPRSHGLWPHWVRISSGGIFEIVPGTEWSSVDTAIAAIGLLDAQQFLDLDTSATEQMLHEIEWSSLIAENGISHGYSFDNILIPYAWDVFGGESWLVELAYASATGEIAPLAYASAPTANGSGFIDELAWLYIKPPDGLDYWGTDWTSYRSTSAIAQIQYYPTKDASACLAQLGLFGLSAAEVPVPAQAPKENIYQAFGMGGRFSTVNDGSDVLGSPATTPHYSAMIASLQPKSAIGMWDWMISEGYFSPLNNVESLTFPSDCARAEWNQLKGSWNLALQALGWGRYLAERDGHFSALWQATRENPFLQKGYLLLAPNELVQKKPMETAEKDFSAYLQRLSIPCVEESDYKVSLPGEYQYQVTDIDGITRDYYVRQTAGNQFIAYKSVLGWPPVDNSIPPWFTSTSSTEMEDVSTAFGRFHALRMDTMLEYHIQTDNHSDPNGTVKRYEWYVCGLGLVRGTMTHTGMYVTTTFERKSMLQLISFAPIP